MPGGADILQPDVWRQNQTKGRGSPSDRKMSRNSSQSLTFEKTIENASDQERKSSRCNANSDITKSNDPKTKQKDPRPKQATRLTKPQVQESE